MIKVIAGALVGIAIIILGIFVWYTYISSFAFGANHLLFPLSIIQIGIGIYVLFWASNSSDPYKLMGKAVDDTSVDVLKRSDEIVRSWYTNDDNQKTMFIKITPPANEEKHEQ
jgi:hypothetical protein